MAEHKHTSSPLPTQENRSIRAAIYGRVSTANHGQDVGMQITELRQFAAARGWQIANEYTDHATGSKDSRPALNQLMADAHKRQFDVVAVWKFDRFARSTAHLLRALETFRALGIDFCSYSEQLDTTTPAGKMVFTVLGAVAELERSLIVERVKAGLRHARAKGRRLGRPRSEVDLSRLKTLRAAGCSWRTIADEMGVAVSVAFKAYKASAAAARTSVVGDASLSEADSERLAARE